MQIRRSVNRDGNLLPSAYNFIESIPDRYVFSDQHRIRNPKSAYGTSLRLISEQWIKFTDDLNLFSTEYYWEGKDTRANSVISEYRELLYRLNEHIDACYKVFRSLCPPSMVKANKTYLKDFDFFKNAKPPGWKKFIDAIEPYQKNHIGFIVNKLKHDQGELCPIYFKSATEFRPGYYLKDVLDGETLGPSAKLHSGGNTAFSFARDSLIHLWWVYRIGELLSNALDAILKTQHKYQISLASKTVQESKWDEMINVCAQISPAFFPDEIIKPYPKVILSPSTKTLDISFSTTARGIPLPNNMIISSSLVIDGGYLKNKMPYFGEYKPTVTNLRIENQ